MCVCVCVYVCLMDECMLEAMLVCTGDDRSSDSGGGNIGYDGSRRVRRGSEQSSLCPLARRAVTAPRVVCGVRDIIVAMGYSGESLSYSFLPTISTNRQSLKSFRRGCISFLLCVCVFLLCENQLVYV